MKDKPQAPPKTSMGNKGRLLCTVLLAILGIIFMNLCFMMLITNEIYKIVDLARETGNNIINRPTLKQYAAEDIMLLISPFGVIAVVCFGTALYHLVYVIVRVVKSFIQKNRSKRIAQSDPDLLE